MYNMNVVKCLALWGKHESSQIYINIILHRDSVG